MRGYLWLCSIVGALTFLGVAGVACSGAKKAESATLAVDALNCRAKLSQIIQTSATCSEASANMRYLVEVDSSCAELFRGRGIALTCGDGK